MVSTGLEEINKRRLQSNNHTSCFDILSASQYCSRLHSSCNRQASENQALRCESAMTFSPLRSSEQLALTSRHKTQADGKYVRIATFSKVRLYRGDAWELR
ncbi:hypothetical protein BDR07DRAFT_1429088 [Suillus spraguei]|nr:hypothetical protein BDR07DRAFT_1429088 [Suillus spraguei]